jgi:hypothetical protein
MDGSTAMSGLVIASILIAIFFAVGVVLGVTMIVSLSVTGRSRRDGGWPRHGDPVHRPSPPSAGLPEPADEETGYDTDGYNETRPHWPDSGYQN